MTLCSVPTLTKYTDGCRCDACRKLKSDYNLEYRQKPENILRRRQRANERYLRQKTWVDKIKMDSGCVDCGFAEHPSALEFDHVSPSKKMHSISSLLGRGWSDKSIRREIAKCVVRCANCHRIKTVREDLFYPTVGDY